MNRPPCEPPATSATRPDWIRGPHAPGGPVELARGQVHVWFSTAAQLAGAPNPASALLDAQERERAARFVFQRDRDRYVLAHVFLRQVLAAYAGVQPQALRFEAGASGKPALLPWTGAGAHGAAVPTFSLSHSADAIAVAVARDAEVGLDIEWLRPVQDRDLIVRGLLAPREAQAWHGLDEASREQAFLRLWTRKEAFVKGIGLGLSYPLQAFEVGWSDEVELRGRDTVGWTMTHLALHAQCVGALAVRAHAR